MKDVRIVFFWFSQTQTLKTGIRERFVIIGIFKTGEGGYCVNPCSKQVVRVCLKKRECLRSKFANLGEIVRITHLRKSCGLFFSRQTGEIVDLLAVDTRNVTPRNLGKRSFAEELRPGR